MRRARLRAEQYTQEMQRQAWVCSSAIDDHIDDSRGRDLDVDNVQNPCRVATHGDGVHRRKINVADIRRNDGFQREPCRQSPEGSSSVDARVGKQPEKNP